VLVCLDDVTNAKPHREPVDRGVAALGADPRRALFVGLHDMAGRGIWRGTSPRAGWRDLKTCSVLE
jgi:hypothetical protein